jgi:hypothetical protein
MEVFNVFDIVAISFLILLEVFSGSLESYSGVVNKIMIFKSRRLTHCCGYGLDDRGVGVQVPVGSRIFSTPHCPGRLWGPPRGGKAAGA